MKKIIEGTEYEMPECEICGALANNIVRDFFINENWSTGVMECAPNNNSIHFFCDEHKREPEGMDITESPLSFFYRNNGNKYETI